MTEAVIVMQYVSGESLQSRIDRQGALELCEILRIGMQIADGLSAAHQQGLVHRDIKPSNILLEEDVDRALISDFGLARAADDASLTRTGFHPGTPQYMSPEQAAGQSVDARSDLFSLGSMLYTACTGRPPFRAENSLSVMRRIAESEPTPIQEINPKIPDWMTAVITKLMAKSVQNRLQTAAEVRSLLEAYLSHVQQPLSHSMPTLPWLTHTGASRKATFSSESLFSSRTIILSGCIIAAILVFLWLPIKLTQLEQDTSNAQAASIESDKLSQKEKLRLERLLSNNSLVVVGKLQEGKPTGHSYVHLFETYQILKGKTVTCQVLLSHKISVDHGDPLENQNPTVELPPLKEGEYVLVLRAEEVISSFKPLNPLGFLFEPEPHFNYFIVRDSENHAAWPKGSLEEQYITSRLASAVRDEIN